MRQGKYRRSPELVSGCPYWTVRADDVLEAIIVEQLAGTIDRPTMLLANILNALWIVTSVFSLWIYYELWWCKGFFLLLPETVRDSSVKRPDNSYELYSSTLYDWSWKQNLSLLRCRELFKLNYSIGMFVIRQDKQFELVETIYKDLQTNRTVTNCKAINWQRRNASIVSKYRSEMERVQEIKTSSCCNQQRQHNAKTRDVHIKSL